jgi:CBS domain-containing protein
MSLTPGESGMTTMRQILAKKGTKVWSIAPDDTVLAGLERMAEADVGAMVVLEGRKPVGIFNERRYAREVILKGRSSASTLVREIMQTDFKRVGPDQTVEECMALMTESRQRHLLVMNRGRLLGIVSIGDLVKSIIDEQEHTIAQLVQYVTGAA